MKWLIGTLAAAFAAWVKALMDRAYVKGFRDALEDVERQQKAVDRQMREAARR